MLQPQRIGRLANRDFHPLVFCQNTGHHWTCFAPMVPGKILPGNEQHLLFRLGLRAFGYPNLTGHRVGWSGPLHDDLTVAVDDMLWKQRKLDAGRRRFAELPLLRAMFVIGDRRCVRQHFFAIDPNGLATSVETNIPPSHSQDIVLPRLQTGQVKFKRCTREQNRKRRIRAWLIVPCLSSRACNADGLRLHLFLSAAIQISSDLKTLRDDVAI